MTTELNLRQTFSLWVSELKSVGLLSEVSELVKPQEFGSATVGGTVH